LSSFGVLFSANLGAVGWNIWGEKYEASGADGVKVVGGLIINGFDVFVDDDKCREFSDIIVVTGNNLGIWWL